MWKSASETRREKVAVLFALPVPPPTLVRAAEIRYTGVAISHGGKPARGGLNLFGFRALLLAVDDRRALRIPRRAFVRLLTNAGARLVRSPRPPCAAAANLDRVGLR